jgi:NAD-dependent dihydropyrimidine dehydrogenase PreA subunit
MPFTIIAESCTGCSACEKRCPTGAISGESKKVYFIEPALCIDCGACGVICPDEAIMTNHGVITHVLKRAQRPIAVVHPDNCNGCGVCVDVCPFDCISPSPENHAEYLGKVQVNEKTCVGCMLCEEVCGWDGIYIMQTADKKDFLEALGYEAGEAA